MAQEGAGEPRQAGYAARPCRPAGPDPRTRRHSAGHERGHAKQRHQEGQEDGGDGEEGGRRCDGHPQRQRREHQAAHQRAHQRGHHQQAQAGQRILLDQLGGVQAAHWAAAATRLAPACAGVTSTAREAGAWVVRRFVKDPTHHVHGCI